MRAAVALAVVVLAAAAAHAQDDDAAVKGADVELIRIVRAVGDRIAAIVGRPARSDLIAVRADEPARAAAARARASRTLPADVATARGRSWHELGLGAVEDPAALAAALAIDLSGVTLDAEGARLLVDPARLQPDSGHGDPSEDADASLLLATGVQIDEPVAGHAIVHLLTDEPPFTATPTTDAMLARAALAEGTANVAALILLFGGVGLEAEVVGGTLRPEDALGGRLVGAEIDAASPGISAMLTFAYLDGFGQAASLAKRGDFRRLLAERRTRRTTRDVIHLDRPPSSPPELPAPAFPESLGLKPVDRDALGEEGIVVLVSSLTGKDNLGLMAGDGWVADALWRLEAPGKDPERDAVTVWSTRWISDAEANDFLYSLDRCFQARFPGESFRETGTGTRVLTRSDRTYEIEIKGSEVSLRIAHPAIDAVIRNVPKKKVTEPRNRTPK